MSEEQEKKFIFDVADGQYTDFSMLMKQDPIMKITQISLKGNKYVPFGVGRRMNLVSTIHLQKFHAYNFFYKFVKINSPRYFRDTMELQFFVRKIL